VEEDCTTLEDVRTLAPTVTITTVASIEAPLSADLGDSEHADAAETLLSGKDCYGRCCCRSYESAAVKYAPPRTRYLLCMERALADALRL
jgi:hypothetical protein